MPFLRNAWYVGAWAAEISRTPLVRKILGEPVLFYRKEDGTTVAMTDRCPHRFAPLHQGRLEGDVISCPYHGLAFGPDGTCVHNPHGDIPSNSSLRSYPIAERQLYVWIWMGDPKQADYDAIPDYPELEPADDRRTLNGYVAIGSHFSLVVDNLLDLTHAAYLHTNSLSVPASEGLPKITSGPSENGVYAYFHTRNVSAPGFWRAIWGDRPCDQHRTVNWTAPSMIHTKIGLSPPEQTLDDGMFTRGRHCITPETDTTSHYFWTSTRWHALDQGTDVKIRALAEKAFLQEDEPMLAACQAYMGTDDLFSLKPLLLKTDKASVLARRALNRMIKAETGRSGPNGGSKRPQPEKRAA